MATAPVEEHTGTGDLPSGTGELLSGTGELLAGAHAALTGFAADFSGRFLLLGRREVADTVARIEELSRIVDHLQVLGAHAADQHRLADPGDRPWASPADGHRASPVERRWAVPGGGPLAAPGAGPDRAGGARAEAARRLRLAAATLPAVPAGGLEAPAALAVLGAACGAGQVSGRAASLIRDAVDRVRPVAGRPALEAMERHLTHQAVEGDEDILRAVARRWENALDQDGQEPTEKLLRARQGVFLRGRRNGLHLLEIGATDEQFEHLATVMTTATNPRLPGAGEASGTGSADGPGGGTPGDGTTGDGTTGDGTPGEDPGSGSPDASRLDGDERPTRAQQLLEALVGACRIALAGTGLPAAGGHRPQVMVTIDYRTLIGELDRAGDAVFARQIPARSIRRLACDADLIPLVLGGKGQVLDLGRAQRLFPAHLRRALVARDKGCAFPGCTIPATWCEAHHITPWETGGTTKLSDGVLLCSHHHHRIHDGPWSVHSRHGIPWFLPPHHLDPEQKPRRNRYWTAGPPQGTTELPLE
ncbi:HNH endonuclease [Arthrobacter crusticola]|uniref:HNH endonuclease n=1 Tax=Arthrobacter crusticola TaxID=2547960 RepID=A0A4R5TPJ5_9MICC|nr:HNH endonuclease signature motif containing protein [Arthrobacter crusticola]TDK24048.1 HNH endonuclease [Arthrobacter crusticola]